MTESQFKTKCVRRIKQDLPGVWVYHPSDKWKSGVPDLIITYKGIPAAIELKVGKNKPTRLQLYTLEKLAAAGAITRVAYDMDAIRDVIDKIKLESIKRGLRAVIHTQTRENHYD